MGESPWKFESSRPHHPVQWGAGSPENLRLIQAREGAFLPYLCESSFYWRHAGQQSLGAFRISSLQWLGIGFFCRLEEPVTIASRFIARCNFSDHKAECLSVAG